MIRSCRNIWEKFSVTSEVIAILMIIALVLFLQFWGVMADLSVRYISGRERII